MTTAAHRVTRPATTIPLLWVHLGNPEICPPQRFSTRQVTVGPNMQSLERDGQHVTLRTPRGRYDLERALAPLGSRFTPEIVLVYADASCMNLPENLDAVPGVKVLVVGDTHHLERPLQTMISYARSQRFEWTPCANVA